jgi:hypothetical protein
MERRDMMFGEEREGGLEGGGVAVRAGTVRDQEGEHLAPAVPRSLDEAGLGLEFVSDLILKTLYTRGACTGIELSQALCLPFGLLDDPLMDVQQRALIEVRGVEGHGRQGYVFDVTKEGRTRAREILEANPYVGPAPVPGPVYRRWVRHQSIRSETVSADRVRRGFRHLVLDHEFLERVGPGINAGRSIFLYGPPGNGKTEVAYAISGILGSHLYIPYAVEIGGHTIALYDSHVHERADEDDGLGDSDILFSSGPQYDPRFVRVKRPAVMVGGELTLDQLELQYDRSGGVYMAPPQMKANGGVFVIDDFGRQRVRPRDLLNRWMIPLDKGIDYLGLPTGQKLEVPFDCLVVFSTNLNPSELVEEAFLRRIRYKILMGNPNRDQFGEIFRRMCVRNGITYDDGAVDYIFTHYYEADGIAPRSCHPRDILADLIDLCTYKGIEPDLAPDLLAEACRSYFIDMPKPGESGYQERGKGVGRAF